MQGLTLLQLDPAHGAPPLGAVVHVVPIETNGGKMVSTFFFYPLRCSGVFFNIYWLNKFDLTSVATDSSADDLVLYCPSIMVLKMTLC